MSYAAIGILTLLILIGLGLAKPSLASSTPVKIMRLAGLGTMLLFATFGFLASAEPGADPHYVFHGIYTILFLVCMFGLIEMFRSWIRP